MLTKEQIRYLLERLGEETVVEPTERFPYRVTTRNHGGYSKDADVGAIQVALSIMLERERAR